MNNYKKRNYRGKRSYSGRPHRRTADSYHQPLPPEQNRVPHMRHTLTKPDVEAVVDALLSGTLTQGRELERFESLLSKLTHSDYAIALSSETAAIHATLACLKLEPEDEVIVSTLNSCNIVNMIKLIGAKPILVDCDPDTLTLSPKAVEAAINPNTKALFPNNFGGHPADLSALRELCDEHNLLLLEEASHGLGGKYRGHYVGNQADITCFSFRPSMAITTCEGGAVSTNNRTVAERIRLFRNHGKQFDPALFQNQGEFPGYYHELQFAGMNYKMSELHAALGRSQLTRLDRHIERRRSIAQVYFQKLGAIEEIMLPRTAEWADHAFHFFTVQFTGELASKRDLLYNELKAEGIDTQVHFIPIHRMPHYAGLGRPEQFPNAELYFSRALSLPLFPDLSYKELERICEVVLKLISRFVGVKETPGQDENSEKSDVQQTEKGSQEESDSSEKSPKTEPDKTIGRSSKGSDQTAKSSATESIAEIDPSETAEKQEEVVEEKKPRKRTSQRSRSSRPRKEPRSNSGKKDKETEDKSAKSSDGPDPGPEKAGDKTEAPKKPARKPRRRAPAKQDAKTADSAKPSRKPRKPSASSGKKATKEPEPDE